MVILDKIRPPPKNVLYVIGISALLFVVLLMLMLYKKYADNNESELMAKQVVNKELQDKNSYNNSMMEIYNSPNLVSMKTLYNELFKDKLFFEVAGWKQDEIFCNANVCNVRYLIEKDRLFEYVVLSKGGVSYQPIFNDAELTYEGVVYAIDMESNKYFEKESSTVAICTEFISKSYKFKTLLSNDSSAKLILEVPDRIFSLSKKYDWATYSDLKKGVITFSTTDIFNMFLIQEEYNNDLVKFEMLNLKDKDFTLSMSFYCF